MISANALWMLPDGVDELLPDDAAYLELLRRDLLDLYRSWGYQLVIPPPLEFLESLLTGSGTTLDLETFKVTDQFSGKLMGLRADITPQVARMDAHRLHHKGVNRLCYLATVLRARSTAVEGSRCPVQLGCELFGHQGTDSDLEVLALMMETLKRCQVANVHVDLGHVGVFRALTQSAGLASGADQELLKLLQAKAIPDMRRWLAERNVPAAQAAALLALADLHGDLSTLDKARERLSGMDCDAAVLLALDELQQLGERFQQRYPAVPLHVDLAELRGYHYHTGAVFAALVLGHGRELARGGRYNGIGEQFGNGRPATGFSADLKMLTAIGELPALPEDEVIYAPATDEPALWQAINELRQQGRIVRQALDGEPQPPICKRLVNTDGQWRVE